MKDSYQRYYTTCKDIVDFMVASLDLQNNALVMEPCAGNGVFIEALLKENKNIRIEAFEMDEQAYSELILKYGKNNSIKIKHTDTLLESSLLPLPINSERYDYIIANPPYGAWQDYTKRKLLKRLYDGFYIKETYTTFLYQAINLLKEGGRLAFIIPNTFLTLHMHTDLREVILKKTKIINISVFPSKFFPNISFGYASLAIIVLQKCNNESECFENNGTIYTGFSHPTQLMRHTSCVITHKEKQKRIFENLDHAFLIATNTSEKLLVQNAKIRLGDIADCVTGFYTGNDKQFIRVLNKNEKRCSSFEEVDKSLISTQTTLDGITGDAHFIPIIRGGGTAYYKPSLFFVDWGNETVQFYKSNKKARFQNSKYYFKTGIGVPMVSSNKITASIIDGRLFDQGIVGIFAKDDSLIYYLLGFLNSSIASSLMRIINPTANNSSNYIKKLPIIFTDNCTTSLITTLVKNIILLKKKNKCSKKEEKIVDDMFTSICEVKKSII